MSLLSRLSLSRKLALVLLVLLVPITYLTWQYVARLQADLRNDSLALDGLEYIAGLDEALTPITRHGALSVAAALGEADAAARLPELQAQVDAGFAKFDAARRRYGSDADLERTWAKARDRWATIRSGWQDMTTPKLRSMHAALLDDVDALCDLLASDYMLNRGMDPYVMAMKNLVGEQVPRMQQELGAMRQAAIEAAASDAPVAGRLLENLGDGYGGMQSTLTSAARGLEVAAQHPTHGAAFTAILQGPLAQGRTALGEFHDWLQDAMPAGRVADLATEDVLKRGAPVVRAIDSIEERTRAELTTVLEERRAASALARNVGLATVAALLAVALVLGGLVSRSITRGMRQAVGAFGRIQQGHFDNEIVVSSGDEVGQVLKGLAEMQSTLKERIERDRAVAAENGRIRTALDKVSTNVMLADADGTIIYMNDAVQAMFRQNAPEIRRQLPQFDPERILGANIDSFHRNPAHQRGLLSTLSGMHSSEMKLGGATLKIVANPVVDAAGVRLGTAVQWYDRTQEVATEDEIDLVVNAALDGDLLRRIRAEGKTGFFAVLAKGMNGLLDNMADVVRTIQSAAREVSSGADEISRGNQNLSQRTEEQASSLEETASSMEEMTSTVKQNADNAQQANQLALAARLQAEKGGEVVSQAVAAMGEINRSSRKIADIIGVIDEIAFQTNLLALNAAVEAARAGEQGRGFAVVASEVRNLASRSAEAAKEIKALIQDSVGKVDEGAKLVDQSGQTLGEIVASVKKVTDIVAEISAASQEQSSGIEQVNKAVMSMDEVTQQNAALVEEAAAAAEALMDQAQTLADLVGKYRTDADDGVTWSGHDRRQVDEWRSPPRERTPEERAPAARRVRPKTPEPAKAAKSAAAPVRSVRKAAGGEADGEWNEF